MSEQVDQTTASTKKPLIRKGFVVALVLGLGLLVGVVVMVGLWFQLSTGACVRGKPRMAKNQIRNFEMAVQLFYLDNGFYPTTCQGLQALVEKPSVEPVPQNYKTGGYLASIPLDPWRNEYIYINQGQKFFILSFGADGQPGGEGDDADVDNLRP